MSDQSEPKAPQPQRADPPASSEAGDTGPPRPKRRRGSRGGRNRNRAASGGGGGGGAGSSQPSELPEKLREGRPQSVEAADRALVRKPQIGDSRPAPKPGADGDGGDTTGGGTSGSPAKKRRRRGGRGRSGGGGGGGQRPSSAPVKAVLVDDSPLELDDDILEQRRGRERKGRPLGRYLMAVHVQRGEGASFEGRVAQIAVLEGRALLEHYVSRP